MELVLYRLQKGTARYVFIFVPKQSCPNLPYTRTVEQAVYNLEAASATDP